MTFHTRAARRVALLAPLALCVLAAAAQEPDPEAPAPQAEGGTERAAPTPLQNLHAHAAARADEDPRKLAVDLPASLARATYDQVRSIRFDGAKRPWRSSGRPFEIEPLHLGGRYRTRVDLALLPPGAPKAVPYAYDPAAFAFPDGVAMLPGGSGFSGLRAFAPLRRPDEYAEFLVLQGASYFRAVGRDHGFGASARGLALGTAEPEGEEFPAFTYFLVEEPDPTANTLVLHGLLESESVTGVQSMRVTPGEETVIEVDTTFYPRTDLASVGLAPLTSMFLFQEGRGRRYDDFRSAVHDSDGLGIVTGAGERLWRPLANPRSLQISAFVDENPRGFGLLQRARTFDDFGDVEARYERRPSVWVEPVGEPWGKGSVVLVEIPTDGEFNDNVVAFWRPAEVPRAGEPLRLRYRLRWCDAPPDHAALARVRSTRTGRAPNDGARLVVVDFVGLPAGAAPEDLRAVVSAANGAELRAPRLESLPGEAGGLRVTLELDVPDGDSAHDLTLQLVDSASGEARSEKWLYRWTR